VIGMTLGAADEQIGQRAGAGDDSYRSSVVKALARLAADPVASGGENESWFITSDRWINR
jgi:hypothetical protein